MMNAEGEANQVMACTCAFFGRRTHLLREHLVQRRASCHTGALQLRGRGQHVQEGVGRCQLESCWIRTIHYGSRNEARGGRRRSRHNR
jgi:hypothetical protein